MFAKCVNAGDLDGIAMLYEPAGKHIKSDATVVFGRASIRKAQVAFVAMRPWFQLTVKKTVELTPGMAVVYDSW